MFGARPLKRAIQQLVETPLSRKLIGGEISDGDTVTLEVSGSGEFGFTVQEAAPAN